MGQRSRRRARESDEPKPDRMAELYARGRAKDAEARRGLEPLAEGERPTAVTVAAVIATILAPANIVSALVVGDSETSSGALPYAILQSIVLLVAAVGMWRAKYWAVLGFQALLAIQMLLLSLALLTIDNVLLGIGVAVIIACFAFLFWKLVRAMARLQMPERRPRAGGR